MTDKEIIQALECCQKGECGICNRLSASCSPEIECRMELMQITLDLINRQQAEIELLKGGAE